jgi:hypothetical protein
MSSNFITLTEATDLINRYRKNLDSMLTPDFTGALLFSETFDADAVRAILNQTGCVSFRTYYGMNAENKVCSIFVGVDDKGVDILNGEDSVIVENGTKCPPDCTVSSF